MKNLQIVLLCFYCFTLYVDANAQKSDIIFKVDSTLIRGYNVQVKNREVTYRLKTLKNAPTFSLKTHDVVKIVFANGRTSHFQIQPILIPRLQSISKIWSVPEIQPTKSNRVGGERPDLILTQDKRIIESEIIAVNTREIKYVVSTDSNKAVRIIKRKRVLDYEKNLPVQISPQPIVVQKTPIIEKPVDTLKLQKPTYRYSSIMFYVEGAYIPARLSPQWANPDVGMGLTTTLGGRVRLSKRFNRGIAFGIEAGFMQWQADYIYKQNGEKLYTSSMLLRRLPLSIGGKIYIGKRFYVSPQIHVDGLQLAQRSSNNSISDLTQTQQTLYWGGSGTIGYELRIGSSFLIDMGLCYTYLPSALQKMEYAFTPINNPLQFLGAKIGIGFCSFSHY